MVTLSARLAYVAAVLLAGTGVAVAATARSATTEVVAAAPNPVGNATFDALTTSTTISYPGVDAVLRATSDADQLAVVVTADQAVQRFAANPLRPELAKAPRVLRLMRYTDMFPKVRNALVWAVIVPDAPVVVYKGDVASTSQGKCDFVILIDARNGANVGAFQSCGRQLQPAS